MKRINEVVRVNETINGVSEGISVTDTISNSLFRNELKFNKKIMLPDKIYNPIKKKTEDVNIELKITYEDSSKAQELNYFDKAVHDAICGLWYAEIPAFTNEFIYRMMVGDGKAHTNFLSKGSNLKDLLEKSIISQNNIRLSLKVKDINGKVILTINDNLLTIVQCKVIVRNGKEINGWKLLSEPALYQYAKTRNRVECFKLELLKTPLNFTEDNIKLIKFLFDRVLLIKSKVRKRDEELWEKFKNCDIIRFSKIYNVITFDRKDHSSKNCIKKSRISEKCETIFDYWMNEVGILRDWMWITEDNNKVGYRLKINLNGFKKAITHEYRSGKTKVKYIDVVFREHEDEYIDEWEKSNIKVIEYNEITDDDMIFTNIEK